MQIVPRVHNVPLVLPGSVLPIVPVHYFYQHPFTPPVSTEILALVTLTVSFTALGPLIRSMIYVAQAFCALSMQ